MKPIVSYNEIISTLQIDADRTAFELLKVNDEINAQRKFILLNEFVDFNCPFVLPYLIPLFVTMEAIDFILKHNSEIKRKFTIEELMDFSDKLKLLILFKLHPGSFAEFRKMYNKIKSIEN